MTLIILFFVLSSVGVFCSTFVKVKFEKALPISFFGIILLQYIFGFFGILKFGFYFVLVIISCLYIACVIAFVLSTEKSEILKNIFTDGFLLFAIFYLFFILFHNGRMFTGWDEFSHWGTSIKSMYLIDDFSVNPKANILFKSYPPAITLLQYFPMKLTGHFMEWYAYFVYDLCAVSLLIMFLKFPIKNRVCKTAINFIFLLAIPVVFFRNYYQSIYVDAIVGIFFSFSILLVFENNKFNIVDYILFFSSIAILPLLKDVGLFFAILALVFFVIKQFLSFKNKKISKSSFIITSIFSILVILVSKYSWKFLVQINNVPRSFGQKINFKQVLNVFLLRDNSYRFDVLKNFIKNLNDTVFPIGWFGINISTVVVCIIFLVFVILLLKHHKNNKTKYKEVLYLSIIMIFGCFAYIVGLLVLYLSRFSAYEAVRLASYSRYVSIYFTAVFIFFVIQFFNCEKKLKLQIATVVIFVMFILSGDIIFFKKYLAIATIEKRKPYTEICNVFKEKIDKASPQHIYIIDQRTSGFSSHVLRYELMPHKISSNPSWTLGDENEDDIYTKNISPKAWQDILINNYDFLIVFKSNDEFYEKYGELFDDKTKITDKSIFKINKQTKMLDFYIHIE